MMDVSDYAAVVCRPNPTTDEEASFRLSFRRSKAETWLTELRANAVTCEDLRQRARYNTGTISEAACLFLRLVTDWILPKVAIEIGTFIGSSALAMRADRIYTCDKSNDCGPLAPHIVCHPYTGSTRMLSELARRGVQAEFFFLDGRIKDADERLILQLSNPSTVYAFDDYEAREKGVLNVERMAKYLPHHRLIEPPADVFGLPTKTTIALLVPR